MASSTLNNLPFSLDQDSIDSLDQIANRALVTTYHMIWEANHRKGSETTDPKVGGHPAACGSSLHLATAMHMVARAPQDFWCGKPHMAPLDHSLHHLLQVFRHKGQWLGQKEGEEVMHRLRYFSADGSPTFQSYHATSEPDSWRILPSGTVGIPPVNSGYLALAQRYLEDRNMVEKSDTHFWSLLGDSEFREGSLFEAITDFGERELKNVTWILDYNRQSLDGTRITNTNAFDGTDADRIHKTMLANGWNVIELKHGQKRRKVFQQKGGVVLKDILDKKLSDFDLQALLWKRDPELIRNEFLKIDLKSKEALDNINDKDLLEMIKDLGGHDIVDILQAYEDARASDKPTLILAHTIKGIDSEAFAMSGNHSSLPSEDEIERMLKSQGLTSKRPYQIDIGWKNSKEILRFLEKRSKFVRQGIEHLESDIAAKEEVWQQKWPKEFPQDFGVNIDMMPVVHTQWMWGQVANKLTRVGVYQDLINGGIKANELTETEKTWQNPAEMALTLSPDVGTSTNINPSMDGKVYGNSGNRNWEEELDWHERGRPELIDSSKSTARHIRFEIAEQAAMSAAGSFGMSGQLFGVPLMPMMTIYDFFIKRALDQLYYNVYWRSSFLLIGTPSGVALSPEGAQHSWKSDIQMPSMITWEPCYAKEMEWILADATRRHCQKDNYDREGVVVRAVTMGVKQKSFINNLKSQARFADKKKDSIFDAIRKDVLSGGYVLVDNSHLEDYQPGENVVNILVMGSAVDQALQASEKLKQKGIYANIIICTSADLLLGRFAEKDNYKQLKSLGINGNIHLVATAGETLDSADVLLLGARQVPIVSIADGELGLLDNAGSILGVPQIALGVKKFSKSGKPDEVFTYHGMDAESIQNACGEILARATLTQVKVSPQVLSQVAERGKATPPESSWRDFWPEQ